MRELLFKAKRLDTGEWVEGYPFPFCPGGEIDRMIVYEDMPGGYSMNIIEIVPTTVCQYTGLTDKNGVKVFQGDVVQLAGYEPDLYVIAFENFAFYVQSIDGHNFLDLEDAEYYWVKVIGNIHDKEVI